MITLQAVRSKIKNYLVLLFSSIEYLIGFLWAISHIKYIDKGLENM